MAPVAKSMTAPGQNKTTSATRATTLICLEGSPTGGLVRWHSVTVPPSIVAQEVADTM